MKDWVLNTKAIQGQRYEKGDVFQIVRTTEDGERQGWLGSFVMATEIKDFGIIGFVHHIESHEESSAAPTRLEWRNIAYVGKARLIPKLELEAYDEQPDRTSDGGVDQVKN